MSDQRQILELVSKLNNELFVPDIQRDFEWNKKDILAFFDSVLCNYPVGIITIWDYKGEFEELNSVYKFVENWSVNNIYDQEEDTPDNSPQGISHNPELLSKDTEQETSEILSERTDEDDFKLVIDGQQRLTSLLIGLYGSVSTKKSVSKLYINLNEDLNSILSEETGIRDELTFDLEFKRSDETVIVEKDDSDDEPRVYYKLSDLPEVDLNTEFKSMAVQDKIKREMHENGEQETWEKYHERIDKVASHLTSQLVEGEIPVREYSTDSFDEILQLFLRINTKGEQLSDSDVLMSVITTQWGTTGEPKNAREEIRNFRNRIDYSFDDMFKPDPRQVTLPLLLPIEYEKFVETYENDDIQTISNLKPSKIRRTKQIWEDGYLLESMNKVFELVTSWNYDQFLGDKNKMYHLYPVIYFFYCEDNDVPYDSKVDVKDYKMADYPDSVKNTLRIRYWLAMSNLTDEFTSMKELEKIKKVYETVKENSGDGMFPLKEIDESIGTSLVKLTDYKISDSFERKSLSGTTGMSVLALMYHSKNLPDEPNIDHLQPDSIVGKKSAIEEYDVDLISEYLEYSDRVSNRAILPAAENKAKNDLPLDEYMEEVREECTDDKEFESFKNRHYIPDNENEENSGGLWSVEEFPRFRRKRAKIIKDELKKNFKNLYRESEFDSYPEWCE